MKKTKVKVLMQIMNGSLNAKIENLDSEKKKKVKNKWEKKLIAVLGKAYITLALALLNETYEEEK